MEGSSIQWVGTHRLHHQYSDEQLDPHSPVKSFFWSHIGWMIYKNRIIDTSLLIPYASDLVEQRFHKYLHKTYLWLLVPLFIAFVIFLSGYSYGYLTNTSPIYIALSWVLLGVFARTVLVWHITWSINSLTLRPPKSSISISSRKLSLLTYSLSLKRPGKTGRSLLLIFYFYYFLFI